MSLISSGTTTSGDAYSARVDQYRQRVDACLEAFLPPADTFPSHLHEAMRYAVLSGGKRVRPLLAYACGEALGVSVDWLDAPAAAVELIHAFSLVHDDLPAMDDDDLRRGRPTTHIQFGEATAILAGDALQTLAFRILVDDPVISERPDVQIAMIRRLGQAAGSTGMTGGQAQDLLSEGKRLSRQELQTMHHLKTGYLIRASIMMACDCDPDMAVETFTHIEQFADKIGLAFQVCDDILDIEGSTEELGKPQGSDLRAGKATFPSVLGMPAAKQHLDELYHSAINELEGLPINCAPLLWMANYITHRNS